MTQKEHSWNEWDYENRRTPVWVMMLTSVFVSLSHVLMLVLTQLVCGRPNVYCIQNQGKKNFALKLLNCHFMISVSDIVKKQFISYTFRKKTWKSVVICYVCKQNKIQLIKRLPNNCQSNNLTLSIQACQQFIKKLRGSSPPANYTDRTTASCRRS
jgi:hypothetical protein